MDTAKYAYEIQVAGKDASGNLACTKFAASYRKTLDVKDVGVEIGITSPAALEAKTRISGHAKFVEVFGGFHNRIGSPVFMQVHLRVAVYQAGQPGQLVYTTGWYGAPSGDILHWPWPADCAWVQEQKGEGNQVVKAAEKAGGASAPVGGRKARAPVGGGKPTAMGLGAGRPSKYPQQMTPSQAATLVRDQRGPKGITRIDPPKVKGEQWHAHLGKGEGSPAINRDGTWKHGGNPPPKLTNDQKDFLKRAGWNV